MQTKPFRTVHQNENCAVMTSYEPVLDGHCIVLPKLHRSTWHDLTEKESHSMWKTANEAAEILKDVYGLDCIILANKGNHATQSHIHIHVIPIKQNFRELVSNVSGASPRERASDQKLMETRERIAACWR